MQVVGVGAIAVTVALAVAWLLRRLLNWDFVIP
jgi:hypothetical protein